MDNVIQFKCKQTREFENRLKQICEICDLIKAEKEATKTKWIMQNKDGFIKVIEGHGNPPPSYSIASRGKAPNAFSAQAVDDYDLISTMKIDFSLVDQLTDGSFLFLEMN